MKAHTLSQQGDLQGAASAYKKCIDQFAGEDGTITMEDNGNGLHVHLYNQYGEVDPP